MSEFSELAATLNDHSVTDENGSVNTESAPEEVVEEPIQEEETPQVVETPAKVPSKAQEEDDLVEDENTGRKYIPEKRFTEVYRQKKELERKVQELESVRTQTRQPSASVPLDRTEVLETELLYSKMPEFDPSSENYDRKLDELAFQYYRPEMGVTKIEAARKAKEFVKQLSQSQDVIKKEARVVKIAQAEGSIAKRSTGKDTRELDPSKMSLEDKESYLKSQGLW